MSQGNQSYLRFSLEESVWFQRGQEVAELVSVSLDPNITIQESEQYVAIRGSLELTGEYKSFHEQQALQDEDSPSLKFVHSVREKGEGSYEFLHRFPVDITIPKNRIRSIYDIDISIESFDYSFPERDHLKLDAELAIIGLYGEQQHETDADEAAEELEVSYREEGSEEDASDYILDLPEAPSYSFTEQNHLWGEENEDHHEAGLYAPFTAEGRKNEMGEQAEDASFQHSESAAVYSFSEFRNEMNQAEDFEVVEAPQAEEPAETAEEVPEENPAPAVEETAEESSSSPEKKKKPKPNMKKGISIAEFLARKDEAAEVAKIKVYIVQQGDTLQLISERYDIPVQQLLRVNHLGIDHEVHEGQVLYVPGTAVHL